MLPLYSYLVQLKAATLSIGSVKRSEQPAAILAAREGFFRTKAERNQGSPDLWLLGTGRYRGRPLQAEACWIHEGSWCLPLLRVRGAVRFSAEGPVTLIGIQQNLA